jgi:class 3 adenylate cyclase
VERKVATVLFADLVGSTELGEQDPERTRAVLDRFFAAMAEEVERAGGTVEKFAGDAVMAAFGAPAALEDHAERALHAALAMQRRLPDLSERLELRLGVNTGDVVVDEEAESSFVTGDAVNVCARLEQNADSGEILVGERTVQAARGAFEFGAARAIAAKGKAEPVAARPLVRALTLMRPRGVPGVASVFAGRDEELAQLQEAYAHAARDGQPHLVTIAGDAGVGKSRLVRELWQWLGEQPEAPLRRAGRCLPYGNGITYWPIREVLQEQLGLGGAEPPDAVRRALGERAILGLALGVDVAGDLHPLAARDRLRDAWVSFLDDLVAERPLALLIEDVHWAEPPLLELLERTARDVHGPLLLLATMRPEARWSGGRTSATAIELDPLDRSDSAVMLAALPAPARELVVSRAEGNPFFAEELTGTLIDQGHLVRREGGWQVVGELPSESAVPDSVQGVLAARIDLLPSGEKEALQAAAVIGRVFWDGPVRELIGHDADLALLEERDFIRRRAGSSLPDQLEYAIKHALTREVAYSSLPKASRAALHARFAGWLERLEASDELASLLAYHYAEAVRPEDVDLVWAADLDTLRDLRERAVEWLRRAAERSLARYEIDDGLAMLERALELAAERQQRVGVWREIARAHALRFAGEPFWNALQQAIHETDDPTVEAELYAQLSYETATRSGIWKSMPAPGLVDDWIERALAGAPPHSAARAMALIARGRWHPLDGNAAAIEASEIAEELGDAALRSAAWDVRGIVAFVAGEFDLGRAWAERRFELLDEISDPDIRADIHAAPISGCIWSGRFREARRLAGQHDRIASELTPHHRVHAIAIDLEVEELLGSWDTVGELQARAELDVERNLDTPCVRNARALLVCALGQQLRGHPDEARRLEQRALELWMEGYGMTLDTPRLRLALARGDLGEVERLLALSDTPHGWHRGWFVFANVSARLDGLAELGDRARVEAETGPFLRRKSYLEPFALRALGRVRADEALVADACSRFQELGLDWHATQTRALF